MIDYIQGERFADLHNGIDVIYVKIDLVPDFFRRNQLSNDYVLITHNGDMKITSDLLDMAPGNLKHWFGQNVCVKSDMLTSIPIGLENSQWFKDINKISKMSDKMMSDRSYKNMLYINHNIKTNPSERYTPYKLFMGSKFVTCEMGENGSNFDRYLDNIYNHKFVLCPEGNGTDTHRTWECLYMGSIPIEKKNINNSYYTDLPICFVDDWSDINEQFLNDEYNRIISNKWNMEKLNFHYWSNLINNYNVKNS